MIRRTTSRASAAALLAVSALVAGGLVSPATAATSTGKVKGTVTLGGAPIKAAKVQLYRYVHNAADEGERTFQRVKTDNTDSAGRYDFAGLKLAEVASGEPKYQYRVLVTDRSGRAVKNVRDVQPKKGRTVTYDVRMARASSVTGSVSRADGGSPAELTVDLSSNEISYGPIMNPEFYPVTRTTVQADGTFALTGLAAGSYELVVRADAYVPHCYSFASNVLEKCDGQESQSFVLKAGENRTLASGAMTVHAPLPSRLTGKVTDPSGKALKGIQVMVGASGHSEPVFTRSSGQFTIDDRLEAGSYQLRFSDPKGVWAKQELGGATSRRVQIVPGQAVRHLDASLKSAVKVKTATKAGKGSAKVAVRITRKASGGAPSGTLTLSYDGTSKKVTVKKGKATVTLTGLPSGERYVTAIYSGTRTTAGFTRTILVQVQ